MNAATTTKPLRSTPAPAGPRAAAGFTLVELMVASALALLTVVIVGNLYVSTSNGERTNSSASDISSSGRYALDTLRRDLMQAGFQGMSWAPPATPTTTIPAVAGDCSAGFAINLGQAVWGSNDSNPLTACIPAANYSTGDILVVRRLSATAATALNATTLYLRSAYERAEVFLGSAPPALFTQIPRFDYPLQTTVYYVSPFSNSSTESPKVPGLHRLVLGAGPALTDELVASNVENMQIQYGRTLTDLTTHFYNADGISSTATPSEWNDVTVVRIWLLLRATATELRYQDTSSYVLGDQTITVNDGFRREVFSAVVELRNH